METLIFLCHYLSRSLATSYLLFSYSKLHVEKVTDDQEEVTHHITTSGIDIYICIGKESYIHVYMCL